MRSLSSTHLTDGPPKTQLDINNEEEVENNTTIRIKPDNHIQIPIGSQKGLNTADKTESLTNSKSSPSFDSIKISKANSNIIKRVKETNKIELSYDPINKVQKLNQFEILKEIGVGAHSKVKLGYDAVLSRPVAIKIMNRKERKRSKFTFEKNFKIRNEINILNICNDHQNIIKLFEVLDDFKSRKIYLILQFCSSGEIKWCKDNSNELLVKGPPQFSFQRSREIIRDIMSGLEFLHLNNIIHRDIKPANLLVDQYGTVRISDFGISVILNSSSKFAASKNISIVNGSDDLVNLIKNEGTPAFFAPEICLGTEVWETFQIVKTNDNDSNHFITFAVDVWALGVTAFCILFGRLPFTSKYDLKLFERIVKKPVKKPNFVKLFRNNISNIVSLNEFELAMDFLNELLNKNPIQRKSIVDLKNHPFICFDFNNDLPYETRTKDAKLQEKLKFLAVQRFHSYNKSTCHGQSMERHKIDDLLTAIKSGTEDKDEISLDLSNLNLKEKLKFKNSKLNGHNLLSQHGSKPNRKSKIKNKMRKNQNNSKNIDNYVTGNTTKNNEVSLPINSSFASLDSFYVETFAMTKLNESNNLNSAGSIGNKFKSSSSPLMFNDLPKRKKSNIFIKGLTKINNESDKNKNKSINNGNMKKLSRKEANSANGAARPPARIPISPGRKISVANVISNVNNTDNLDFVNNNSENRNTKLSASGNNNVVVTNKDPDRNNTAANFSLSKSNNSQGKRDKIKPKLHLSEGRNSQRNFKAGSFKIKTGNFFTSDSNTSNSSLTNTSESNSSYSSDSRSSSCSLHSSSSFETNDYRTDSSNNRSVPYQVTSQDASVVSFRNINGFPDLTQPEPYLSLSPKASTQSSRLSNSTSSDSEDELILNIGNGHMRRNQSEQTQKSQTLSLNSNGTIQSPINLHLKRSSVSSQSFGNSSPRPSGTNLSHINMINEDNIVMSNFHTGEIDTRSLLKGFLQQSPAMGQVSLHRNRSNENI